MPRFHITLRNEHAIEDLGWHDFGDPSQARSGAVGTISDLLEVRTDLWHASRWELLVEDENGFRVGKFEVEASYKDA